MAESLEFETAYQLGAMRKFFEDARWQGLTPRFDSREWFSPDRLYNIFSGLGSVLKGNGGLFEKTKGIIRIGDGLPYYSIATDGDYRYVVYFYNANTYTGVVKNMDKPATAQWFNPRAGNTRSRGHHRTPSLPRGGKPTLALRYFATK